VSGKASEPAKWTVKERDRGGLSLEPYFAFPRMAQKPASHPSPVTTVSSSEAMPLANSQRAAVAFLGGLQIDAMICHDALPFEIASSAAPCAVAGPPSWLRVKAARSTSSGQPY
jgi:hypothetical protein